MTERDKLYVCLIGRVSLSLGHSSPFYRQTCLTAGSLVLARKTLEVIKPLVIYWHCSCKVLFGLAAGGSRSLVFSDCRPVVYALMGAVNFPGESGTGLPLGLGQNSSFYLSSGPLSL